MYGRASVAKGLTQQPFVFAFGRAATVTGDLLQKIRDERRRKDAGHRRQRADWRPYAQLRRLGDSASLAITGGAGGAGGYKIAGGTGAATLTGGGGPVIFNYARLANPTAPPTTRSRT